MSVDWFEKCSFFYSRYYSSEVGKEWHKISAMEFTRCLAQKLHQPLLPLEYTTFRKFEELFSLDSTVEITPKDNQEAFFPLALESRKRTGKSRVFNVPSGA